MEKRSVVKRADDNILFVIPSNFDFKTRIPIYVETTRAQRRDDAGSILYFRRDCEL